MVRNAHVTLQCLWTVWLAVSAGHTVARTLQQQQSGQGILALVKSPPVPPIIPLTRPDVPAVTPETVVQQAEPAAAEQVPVATEPQGATQQELPLLAAAAAAAAGDLEAQPEATEAAAGDASISTPPTTTTTDTAPLPQASAPAPDRFIVKVDVRCSSRGSPGGGRVSAMAAQRGGTMTVAAAAQAVTDSPASIQVTQVYDDSASVMPGFAFKASQPGSAETAQLLSDLEADPCVVGVYEDGHSVLSSATYPALPLNLFPKSVQRINAGNLEATKANNPANVDVALIDTGIAEHPDLYVFQSLDCTNTDEANGKGCRPRSSPADVTGHGTVMAGVIAARNGWEKYDIPDGTLVGVAPGTPLHSLRVVQVQVNPDTNTTTELAYTSDVIAALNWVRQYNSKIGYNAFTGRLMGRKIRVVNLALWDSDTVASDGISIANNPAYPDCGAADPSITPYHVAVCRLTTDKVNGAVVVAAAGNAATDIEAGIPARFPEVLAATSMTNSGAELTADYTTCNNQYYELDSGSFFSNFVNLSNPTSLAASHTVAAPGECIISTAPKKLFPSGYIVFSGTSLSTAAVSGVTALCFGELKTNPRFAQSASESNNGRCEAAFAAGGAAAVIKLLVEEPAFRQAEESNGFFGNPFYPMPDAQGNPVKSYGHLINAATL